MKFQLSLLVVFVFIASLPAGQGRQVFRPAYAEEIDLSLSPPIIEIIATAGDKLKVPITLANHADRKQELSLLIKPFTPLFEDGTVRFTDDDQLDPIRSFISVTKDGEFVDESIILRPDESSDLVLTVDVPKEASAKDHYFTVLFQTNKDSPRPLASDTTASSQVEAGIGSNVLLSIRNPDTPEVLSAKLKEFSTAKVTDSDSIRLKATVENEGSHFVTAKGEIFFKDIRGGEIKRISLPAKRVLAYSSRNLIDEAISLPVLFGKYTAILSIDLGGNDRLTDSISFYVVPKNSLIAITLLILTLALIIIRRFHWYAKQAKMRGFSD